MRGEQKLGIGFIISIAIAQAAGILCRRLAGDMREAFESLKKPQLSPVYAVMVMLWVAALAAAGISAYLAGISTEGDKGSFLLLYSAQYLAVLGWHLLLFRFNIRILALLVALLWCFLNFRIIKAMAPLSIVGAKAAIGYFLWSAYIVYFTAGVFFLN